MQERERERERKRERDGERERERDRERGAGGGSSHLRAHYSHFEHITAPRHKNAGFPFTFFSVRAFEV